MRIDLVLELMDTPGQLVKALEPISGLGANLVTVIHKRDYKNDNGRVPVQLTLEGEREDLKNVVDRFEELGFTIIEMDGVVLKEKIQFWGAKRHSKSQTQFTFYRVFSCTPYLNAFALALRKSILNV